MESTWSGWAPLLLSVPEGLFIGSFLCLLSINNRTVIRHWSPEHLGNFSFIAPVTLLHSFILTCLDCCNQLQFILKDAIRLVHKSPNSLISEYTRDTVHWLFVEDGIKITFLLPRSGLLGLLHLSIYTRAVCAGWYLAGLSITLGP